MIANRMHTKLSASRQHASSVAVPCKPSRRVGLCVKAAAQLSEKKSEIAKVNYTAISEPACCQRCEFCQWVARQGYACRSSDHVMRAVYVNKQPGLPHLCFAGANLMHVHATLLQACAYLVHG
jgi:2-iminoacetate synthase ThiH